MAERTLQVWAKEGSSNGETVLDYPGDSKCHHMCPCKREAGGDWKIEGKGLVTMEIELGGMCSGDGGKGHTPRNIRSYQKLEKAKKWSLPSEPRETTGPAM